ncbi:MAG: sensor histidine kinase [Chlorobi bacterium]|nr:sensor histidine kinase [Chlorobiota bacterium]
MKIYLSVIFHIYILSVLSFSQSQNVDSLVTITLNSSNEIERIEGFFELAKIYKYDSTELAEKYSLKALSVSEKINNDTLIINSINGLCPIRVLRNELDNVMLLYNRALKLSNKANFIKGTGVTYNNIGSYYNKINMLDSALYFYLKGAGIFKNIKLFKIAAVTYNNAGIIYYKQANYDSSLAYFIKSLEIKETILPNGKRVSTDNELAASMVNIGLFYYKLKQNNEAIEYLKNAKEKAKLANNNNYACIAETNLGVIYNSLQNYDSALYYYNMALSSANNMNNIQRKASIYTGLANVYTNTNKFNLAIDYFLKSLEIHNKLNDERGKAIVEKNITELYIKEGKLGLAEEYGLKGLNTAIKTKNIEVEKEVYAILAEIYEKSGDYKQAYTFKNKFISIKDSINALNNENIIAEMQTKYETEKKNVEIKELKIKDIENENIQKLFLLIIGFLFIVAIFLVFFFRLKVKTNTILNEKNMQLKQLNITQNRLMSIISHDLKSPLSAFYSITNSLRNKFDKLNKKEIDNYLSRMLNSSIALKLQLENMLNWAINQQRDISVNKSMFNLHVICFKVVMILQEFANEKSITIENSIDKDIEIETDGRLLSIVLNNLIVNAVKFSQPNNKIILKVNKVENAVIISVKDFGIGMSKSDIDNLFLNKEGVAKSENSGTGLGLVVSKDIVEKLGGIIWAESEQGKGSEFFLKFTVNK